jgi:hypothetical protein
MKKDEEKPSNVGMTLLLNYGYVWCPIADAAVGPADLTICRCMFLWIFLSAAVILINKYVLAYSGFPYPIALTCTHMAFCSILAWVFVKLGFADATPLSAETYIG